MDLPRYTQRAFPPYRHRLGQTPHPVTDPRGHSFGVAHPPPPTLPPPDRWRDCEDYLFGCDLFNHAYWWEAHEAWEGLWRAAAPQSLQAKFLQGLIQVAAAMLAGARGEETGARRCLSRALVNLAPVAAHAGDGRYMGLKVGEFAEHARGLADGRGGELQIRIE